MPPPAHPTPFLRPVPLCQGQLGALLSADERGFVAGAAGGVLARDWGAERLAWSVPGPCRAAAAGGSTLALAALDGVRILSLPSLSASCSLDGRAPALLALSPGGERLALSERETRVEVFSSSWGSPLGSVDLGMPLRAMLFSPDERLLACAVGPPPGRKGPGRLVLLDGERVSAALDTPSACRALAFSPDGSRLAYAAGREVRAAAIDGGALRDAGSLDAQPGEATALAFSPDAARLAVGYRGGPIALWRAPAPGSPGSFLAALDGHRGDVRSLRFLAGGAGLASLAADQVVSLWEPPARSPRRSLHLGAGPAFALAASPDGARLLSGHGDGFSFVWNIHTNEPERALGHHGGGVFGVAWSSDGALLATCGADGLARVWGAARGELRGQLQVAGQAQAVAFSPDGRALLIAGDGGTVVWPLPVGARFGALAPLSRSLPSRTPPSLEVQASQAVVPCHALVPCGDGWAVGGDDGKIRLWSGGRLEATLPAHPRHAWALACSPADPILASGGDDGAIVLFDVRFREKLLRFEGHAGRIWSLAFSPDGRLLASASEDGTVRLLDVVTGRCERVLRGHAAGVTAVLWSGSLFSAARDGTVVRWQADRTV